MEEKTATEMLTRMVSDALMSRAAKAHDAAVADAFIYGGGWLLVDQSGDIKHVAPAEVMAWAAYNAAFSPPPGEGETP